MSQKSAMADPQESVATATHETEGSRLDLDIHCRQSHAEVGMVQAACLVAGKPSVGCEDNCHSCITQCREGAATMFSLA